MTHTPIDLLHTHIWYQLFHQKTIHYIRLTYLSLSKLNQSSVPKSSLEILHLNNLWKTALPHPPSVSCTQLHYCRALIDTKGCLQNLKTEKRVKSCIKGGGGYFRIIILNCLERMTYPKGRGAQLHCHYFEL